jgi:dsRNA-specific ribonuclease
MARDEIPELRALRDEYDRAREKLLAGIRKALADGESLAKIGRSVDWSREYIGRIRDGKTGE